MKLVGQRSMNGLDLVLLLTLGWALYRGLLRGFFREMAGYVGLVLSVVAATELLPSVSDWLLARWPSLERKWGSVLAYAVLLAGGQALTHLLARCAGLLLRTAGLGWADRLGGALVALLRTALGLSLLLWLLGAIGLPPQAWRERSRLHGPLLGVAPWTYELVVGLLPGASSYQQQLERAFQAFNPLGKESP
ncbi:MAG: CvpA family protein [Bacteroidota bacterium]|nr:CvpA family protein [Rhodothermia bacterium]MDW8286219.1 CvpA family protein [Bacteroidota bacterium]